MSRIRSIHPGFFTDERLVSTSVWARLLIIGLGVEADDKGIFEWKPVTLKMRLFPADNVEIAGLLAELEQADAIRSYEIDGRKYGAIRNFRKFQRPKTPNDIHPITAEIGIYVSLPSAITEGGSDDGGSFPPKGENHPQMEGGGGRGSGRGGKPSGFPERASAPKKSGFVTVRKTTDALNDVLQELDDNDQRRIGFGGQGDRGDVPMLPAIRAG